MPYKYNTNYKAWRQALLKGGVILQYRQIAGNLPADYHRLPQIAVKLPMLLYRWNLVDLESYDFIGSLATSALAAFLIFKQAYSTVFFSFP